MARIERATSPLPRECSTTEPHGPSGRPLQQQPVGRPSFSLKRAPRRTLVELERETGIEPASLAWKARVLPLNYSRPGGLRRTSPQENRNEKRTMLFVVEEAGFEPA